MTTARPDDAAASTGDERDTRDAGDANPTLRERLSSLDPAALGVRIARMWRRSLQLRVVTSTLALSMGVILTIAFMLQSQMAAQLLSTKLDAAMEQAGRLRLTVEAQIAATDEGTSEQSRLDQARSAISERGVASGGDSVHAGTFDPILVVPDQTGRGQVVSPAAVSYTHLTLPTIYSV